MYDLLSEEQYQDAIDNYGEDSFRAGIGAEAIKELLGEINTKELADSIRDELEASGLVETLGGLNQSYVPLVDEVGEGESLILVLLRDTDHKPEVRLRQSLQRFLVAVTDALCKFYLFLTRDHLFFAYFLKVLF